MPADEPEPTREGGTGRTLLRVLAGALFLALVLACAGVATLNVQAWRGELVDDPAVTTLTSPQASATPGPPAASMDAPGSAATGAARDPAPAGSVPGERATSALAVGDSIMLGAKAELEKRGITVDATISRQLPSGTSLLRSLKSSGELPKKVAVHLGTNGTITSSQLRSLLSVLRDRTRVVVLTLKVPRSWEDANNAVLKRVAKGYRNVRLVDWHWWGNRNPGWLWDDGYHLRPEGAKAYARLIAKALR